MRILALPNTMKGSLSSVRAAHIFCTTLKARHTVETFPISDGGDGFIAFFRAVFPLAKLKQTRAKNAFLKTQNTSYLILPDGKTAILETASICGLGQTTKEELDPLNASSFGIGQVISHAVSAGAKTLYIGLGGVAFNDGGAGMAQALGARLLDQQGRPLALGASPLQQLHTLDLSLLKKHLRGIKIYAVADVTNPLLGPQGSARVYGPQKGATAHQVLVLEKALCNYARIIKKATGLNVSRQPGLGAAGAIATGLVALGGAKLLNGADFLFKKAGLEKKIKASDLVITCEGKLDAQTFCGKAPLAVLKLAHKHKKPVLFICGQVDMKGLQKQKFLPQILFCLSDFAPSLERCQQNAAHYVRTACKLI